MTRGQLTQIVASSTYLIYSFLCSNGKVRLPTESFDEDGSKAVSKKQSKLKQRTVYIALGTAVFFVLQQMLPGGLLANTSIGQSFQGLARIVANTIASVSTLCMILLASR